MVDKEKENLNNYSSVSSAEDYTVVTSDVIPQNVEVIAVDANGHVEAISLEYNEYRNELNSLYSLSTEENSLISLCVIEENRCIHKLTLRNMDGTEEIKKTQQFKYNNTLIENFLSPLVSDYNKYNKVFNSTIEILDENKANFIARTDKNDSLIIMGISVELANKFKDLILSKDMSVNILDRNENISNEKGIGTFFAIGLTVIAIGMTLVGIVFFAIMSNK